MNRNILLLLAVIAMGGLLGCGGDDGPSQSATVIGSVAGISLSPVSGASVNIGGVSSATGPDGTYSLDRVTSGLQVLSVSAAGYISVSRTVDVAPMATTYVPKIVLEVRDSKSTGIGSGGGEATSSDGTIILSIPSGALTSTVSVVVTNCDLLSVPYPVPSGYKLVYLAHISPADTVLLSAATLYIPTPSESPVTFYHFNSSTSTWDSLGAGTPADGKTSISLTKFGWIAAVVPLASPGSITGKVVSSAGGAVAGADVIAGGSIAVTDASGKYTLSNLAAGTVSVNASKAGYSSASLSVTVVAGRTVTAADISLSPVSGYGSVSGKILSSVGSVVIVGARVVAAGKTAYSDSNGNYSISDLSPGAVTVSVYAYGYENKSESVTITAGTTATKDFRLAAVSVSDFSDNFETTTNPWSVISGSWNRVYRPQNIENKIATELGYVVLPPGDSGNLPLPNSGDYCYWFGNSDTGSYIGVRDTETPIPAGGVSMNSQMGTLESPSINLSGYSIATLSFWTWWEIESRTADDFDQMIVMVSDDGVNWNSLGLLNPTGFKSNISDIAYSSGGYDKSGIWVKNQYDLTPYAGKVVKIRFFFNSVDRLSNGFRGWLIDDVSISKDPISPAWRR